MVGRWGMSDKVGLVSVLPGPGEEPNPFAPDGGASPATRELVDAEVRRIVDECYERSESLLRENREKLDALADALLEKRDARRGRRLPRRRIRSTAAQRR